MFIADPVKPVVTMTTTSNEDLSSPPSNKRVTNHTSDDVFSRLDNRRDGVFSRLDAKPSVMKTTGCHGDDSNEVTSQSLDAQQQQQQQPITTLISKRRIKLTDIKDNVTSSSSAHATSIHQPPANKVVCDP